MKKILLLFVVIPTLILAQKFDPEAKYHLVRMDDFGMCHSVNMAVKKVLDSGLRSSVSIMFVCPWYQEAVDILKDYPETAVGIHLTLNAEWKNFRWGPVTGIDAVPSLVDEHGYFFPSRSKLFANNPDIKEIEKELRAQIDRAMKSGIRIDYIDFHMGAAVQTPELRALVEQLAKEHNLALSTYFGEKYSNVTYGASLGNKAESLTSVIKELGKGINLQVTHVGLDTPELAAMEDMNSFGLKEMSKHREGEMKSLLSPAFRKALKDEGIISVNYIDLVKMFGLKNMKWPDE